jgi:DNA-directed RNA polymerase subunit M/transcription elongation factor TFIIS
VAWQDTRHNLTVKLITAEEHQTQLKRLPEWIQTIPSTFLGAADAQSAAHTFETSGETTMAVGAKIAKTADRKKVMDTTKSTDCPKCGKPTRIVKRVKDRERGVPGGIYISCSACEFFEKL